MKDCKDTVLFFETLGNRRVSGLSRASRLAFFFAVRGVDGMRAPTRGDGRPCEDDGLGDEYLDTRGEETAFGEFLVRKLIVLAVLGLKKEQELASFEFGPMSRRLYVMPT